MTAIVDYGVGNLFSLSSSLRFLGLETEVTRDPDRLRAAERILLPGVGAFPDAAERLRASGWRRRSGNPSWASAWGCSCCSTGVLSTESMPAWG